jgi:aspartate 1-decarboxylase
MRRNMFASKIHRATVTQANIDYEGSVTIDQNLMDKANMLAYEEVHVWDVDNGNRLVTYILPGPRDSGTVCINGAAAHLVKVGHKVILSTFVSMEESEARKYVPRVLLVDGKNRVLEDDYQEQPFRVARTS